MPRDTLGEFEQVVLLACLQLGDGAYTVSVIDEIEARTGRSASHAAVYVALQRLESKGLVRSKLAEATAERGGRAKRFFRVTPQAVERLKQSREILLNMWRGLESIAK
ncbi:MAG TPA: PadR family transcriptional regulator [Vicinamibacteria bacterium]|nr:PadR family transcriptional regulator [Vicinamibacteria bacterium]